MKITTNYHRTKIYYFTELPEKWQEIAKAIYSTDIVENSSYVIYNDNIYRLEEFNPVFRNNTEYFPSMWGYKYPQTSYTGIVICLLDNDSCIIGSYNKE